jgi:hypothetical protein
LLCYAWQRYRQLFDNLVDAMAYRMTKSEKESSAGAQKLFVAEQVRRQATGYAAGWPPVAALCR